MEAFFSGLKSIRDWNFNYFFAEFPVNLNASWFEKMARLLLFVLATVLQSSIIFCLQPLGLELVREWKQLDFAFPNDRAKADAIQKKHFIVENTFPIDVDVDYRGK